MATIDNQTKAEPESTVVDLVIVEQRIATHINHIHHFSSFKMCLIQRPNRSRHQQYAKLTSSTSPIHSLTNEEEEGCAIIAFEAELNDAHDGARSTSPLLSSSNPHRRRRRQLRRHRPSASPSSCNKGNIEFVTHEHENAFEKKRRMHQTQHPILLAEQILQLVEET